MGKDRQARRALAKTSFGIKGFDQIALGGLLRERPILVCGGQGSGKILFGMHTESGPIGLDLRPRKG